MQDIIVLVTFGTLVLALIYMPPSVRRKVFEIVGAVCAMVLVAFLLVYLITWMQGVSK